MMNSRDVELVSITSSRPRVNSFFMHMANHETLATVTHIRLPEGSMLDCFDDPRDIFGRSADVILDLTDRIRMIDLDAAVFLYERVRQESMNGTMTTKDIIDMLKVSLQQLQDLSEKGVLYVSAA